MQIAVRKATVFNIQRFSVQDGPGIRTTVFLKGCPLRCLWCSNPESQSRFPEVVHRDSLCDGCGRCVDVCPVHAISLVGDKKVSIDRALCDNCGQCVDACFLQALQISGKETPVEEMFAEARKDELYYRNSNGGVTASGGEPLLQGELVVELFQRCQHAGYHTTVDTCGYAEASVLERVLRNTDQVLYDLKHMDAAAHREATGVSNQLILDNARLIAALQVPMIVRIPLIPTINDSEDNIRATIDFVLSLEQVTEVDLLPYHRFGMGKYRMLDRGYPLPELLPPPEEHVGRLKAMIESSGLKCEIGG